jgi:hypothetical protein
MQWVYILVSAKQRTSRTRNKSQEREVGKKSKRVISKAMQAQRKHGGFIREPIHIHIEKHFRDRHIPEHARLRSTF